MKTNIESLVEEALKKLAGSNLGETYTTNVLTTLAEEASKNGLQPLPEEMPEWLQKNIMNIYALRMDARTFYDLLRQHFGTKPREWWMGLKKGDKFLDCNGISRMYNGVVFLGTDRSGTHEARICSPYTEPTTLEQFMQSLTPEQLELAKRLKIEEGEG